MRWPWQAREELAQELPALDPKEADEARQSVEVARQNLERSKSLGARVAHVVGDLVDERKRNHFADSLNILYIERGQQ